MESTRMMRAIVQKTPGPASTMEIGEAELPKVNADQCLVKIVYTALNRAEIMQVRSEVINAVQRTGQYPPPPGATNIIGLECLGYIIHDIDKDLVEDNYTKNPLVMALLPGGSYAQ